MFCNAYAIGRRADIEVQSADARYFAHPCRVMLLPLLAKRVLQQGKRQRLCEMEDDGFIYAVAVGG